MIWSEQRGDARQVQGDVRAFGCELFADGKTDDEERDQFRDDDGGEHLNADGFL